MTERSPFHLLRHVEAGNKNFLKVFREYDLGVVPVVYLPQKPFDALASQIIEAYGHDIFAASGDTNRFVFLGVEYWANGHG